ncbi:uncharacterized protein LOC108908892 [Anoplophora glabripennis]|uniref:uncharacterized protein LOC108908892 n=1 Tax=Anoplophora glabripennis TaxID=217634 RepID=UPI000874C50E|nr:uncharacterized protein LOC108908892 [Anoplophora glabripennis]
MFCFNYFIMGDQDQRKKTRSANYTHQEKNLLLNIMLEYKTVIESKKSDAVTWRDKEEAWKKITDIFNTQSRTGIFRHTASLKKAYENIKKCTRKEVADEKASLIRTGGGRCEVNTNPNLDLALEIINQKTVYGLKNKYSDVEELDQVDCDNVQENVYMEEIDDDTAILLQVVEDDEDNTENNKTDWGNYKPEDFKKPLHPKLLPKAKKIESSSRKVPLNETTATDDNNLFSTSHWTSRNRPIISTLASSELSKKYNKLAELKIELVQVELDRLKAEQEIKKERDLVEFELRRKSLELDLKIKHIFRKNLRVFRSESI